MYKYLRLFLFDIVYCFFNIILRFLIRLQNIGSIPHFKAQCPYVLRIRKNMESAIGKTSIREKQALIYNKCLLACLLACLLESIMTYNGNPDIPADIVFFVLLMIYIFRLFPCHFYEQLYYYNALYCFCKRKNKENEGKIDGLSKK